MSIGRCIVRIIGSKTTSGSFSTPGRCPGAYATAPYFYFLFHTNHFLSAIARIHFFSANYSVGLHTHIIVFTAP